MTPRRGAAAGLAAGLLLLAAVPAAAAMQDPPPQPSASPAPTAPAPPEPAAFNPYAGYPYAGYGAPAEAPQPTIVGSGADSLIRGPDLRGANEPTLLERYGAQGYSLDTAPGVVGGTEPALNAIAAGTFSIATWLAQAVLALVQWAFSLALFDFVGDAVSAIVGALERLLYLPFVQVAVITAGLYALWHGLLRKRATLAAESMAWTVVALVAAALFFAHPRAVIDAANGFSTGLSRAVLAAVSVADPKSGPADGVTAAPTFAGHPADTELRVAADRFWRVFVYQPWLVLQFGDPAAGGAFGERLLAAKTVTREEYAVASGDPQALAALLQAKSDEYAALQAAVLADPRVADWFRGRRAVERVGVATLALTGVTVGGVLVALVAGSILVAQLALLLVVLLAPIALLLGVHPGAGRVVALRWAQLAAGLLVKRVALAALLAVVIVVNGVLLDATYPLGWLVVMGLQTLMVAAAVVYRRQLLALMGPTTVPVVLNVARPPARAPRPDSRAERRPERAPPAAALAAAGRRAPRPGPVPRESRPPTAVPARRLTTIGGDLGRRWPRRRFDLGLGNPPDDGLAGTNGHGSLGDAPGSHGSHGSHGDAPGSDGDGHRSHGDGHRFPGDGHRSPRDGHRFPGNGHGPEGP